MRLFTVARDVTVHPVINSQKGNLVTRVISALVLMPVVLYVCYSGYPYFNFLVFIFVIIMAWEYCRMISGNCLDIECCILILGLGGAIVLATSHGYFLSFLFLVVLCLFFTGMGIFKLLCKKLFSRPNQSKRETCHLNSYWLAIGGLYLGIPCVSIVWLRNDLENGLVVVVWIFLLVWSADSGAYVAGKLLQGPKLAPSISPKKTWSGLGGAIVSAGIVGFLISRAVEIESIYLFVVISCVVGLISQLGDLLESATKRRFGLKDTGNLIPGHGGILDRVDALLAAVMSVTILYTFNRGLLFS